MSNYLSEMDELEQEFTQELRGYGSLSINLVGDSGGESEYIGYDIRPEDIEALYFEGIKLPRWESIVADNYDEQLATYNASMQKLLETYPLIGRVSDTDQKIRFTSGEIDRLIGECESVLEMTTDEKANRALLKFAVAGRKAAGTQQGLILIPT